MVSGDGENDVPLFQATRQGFKGTMVGNVCEGLKQWVGKKHRENVFQATKNHAEGILEGLHHHFCSLFAVDRDSTTQDSDLLDVSGDDHRVKDGSEASLEGMSGPMPSVVVTDSHPRASVVVAGTAPASVAVTE